MNASIGFQASAQKWGEETRVPGDGGNAAGNRADHSQLETLIECPR